MRKRKERPKDKIARLRAERGTRSRRTLLIVTLIGVPAVIAGLLVLQQSSSRAASRQKTRDQQLRDAVDVELGDYGRQSREEWERKKDAEWVRKQRDGR